MQELKAAGINLKQLLASGKRLVISEWGVGGGVLDGSEIAKSVEVGHCLLGIHSHAQSRTVMCQCPSSGAG